MRSQGKPHSPKLDRKADAEHCKLPEQKSVSINLHGNQSRDCHRNQYLDMKTWTVTELLHGCSVWTSLRLKNSRKAKSQKGPYTVTNFTSKGFTKFP
jgi:hypothetical protein